MIFCLLVKFNDNNFQKGGVRFHTCCGGAADTLPRGSAGAHVPLLPLAGAAGASTPFPSPPGSKLFGMKVLKLTLRVKSTVKISFQG